MDPLSKTGKLAIWIVFFLFMAQTFYMVTLKAELDARNGDVDLLKANAKLSYEIAASHKKLAEMHERIGIAYKDVLADMLDKLDAAKVTMTKGSALAILDRIDTLKIAPGRNSIGGP